MGRNKERIPGANRGSLKVRLILVSVLFVLFGSGLVGRLFFLQVIKNEDLVSRSRQQHQVTVEMSYGRGFIYVSIRGAEAYYSSGKCQIR